jgi:16S rRNA (uracil1498-N3)-methyltransferase
LGRRDLPPLRSLPRVFLPGVDPEEEFFELPAEEVEKFRKVLRLNEGDPIAVLPGDGTLIRCRFEKRKAWVESVEAHSTEPSRRVILAQALPKIDRLETVLRMGTELGIAEFALFPAERSVLKWDASKRADKERRFHSILREAAEQSFRSNLPKIRFFDSLKAVLAEFPEAVILSESESATLKLAPKEPETVIVVGPEGGWAPREMALIGDRGVTLGKLVLRTDTAGIAAASALIFG